MLSNSNNAANYISLGSEGLLKMWCRRRRHSAAERGKLLKTARMPKRGPAAVSKL